MSRPNINHEIHVAAGLEIRGTDDGGAGNTLVGYAAVFDRPFESSYMIEYVRSGAFTRALKEQQDVRALIDHDPSLVLGRSTSKTLRLSEDAKGLLIEIDLPDTQNARDLRTLINRGDVTQMSFGFRPVTQQWDETGPKPVRSLIDVDLMDVSVVTYPAYTDTTVTVRSHEQWRAANHPKPTTPPLSLLMAQQRQAEALIF